MIAATWKTNCNIPESSFRCLAAVPFFTIEFCYRIFFYLRRFKSVQMIIRTLAVMAKLKFGEVIELTAATLRTNCKIAERDAEDEQESQSPSSSRSSFFLLSIFFTIDFLPSIFLLSIFFFL
jgi:hypothetical protein